MTATQARHDPRPTEECPEWGVISDFGVRLSDVTHWVEDGVHCFRSLEYDVFAEDEDLTTAIQIFGEKTEDLFHLLAQLRREGRLTDGERETAVVLVDRFLEIDEERKRRQRRRVPRGRGPRSHDRWKLLLRSSFSQPSSA